MNIQVSSCYGRDERNGIALCIVLVPNGPLYARDFGKTCSFEVNGYQMKYSHLCWGNYGKIELHQLGLQYLSQYRLSNSFDSDWKEVWKAKLFLFIASAVSHHLLPMVTSLVFFFLVIYLFGPIPAFFGIYIYC